MTQQEIDNLLDTLHAQKLLDEFGESAQHIAKLIAELNQGKPGE